MDLHKIGSHSHTHINYILLHVAGKICQRFGFGAEWSGRWGMVISHVLKSLTVDRVLLAPPLWQSANWHWALQAEPESLGVSPWEIKWATFVAVARALGSKGAYPASNNILTCTFIPSLCDKAFGSVVCYTCGPWMFSQIIHDSLKRKLKNNNWQQQKLTTKLVLFKKQNKNK